MTIFRYICIGLGTCAALWGALYGLGYLVTAAASHFGFSLVQLASSCFEGISEPGYASVGLRSLIVLVATIFAVVVLGKVIDRHVLQNCLKTRR
ncbi:hypothetical protein [Pseudomonas sp. UBA3149]|uniref:hypothetical protein n=1 Tax=Pseudomonas sp. UBA3149 TaxID=1947312 RepID=UPI0025800850|nr:hypothetical protein [Pseudomonas sp. UBA3149]